MRLYLVPPTTGVSSGTWFYEVCMSALCTRVSNTGRYVHTEHGCVKSFGCSFIEGWLYVHHVVIRRR